MTDRSRKNASKTPGRGAAALTGTMRPQHRAAVEAAKAQIQPLVRETFEGKTMWEGVVHVFDLAAPSDRDPRLRLVIANRGQHEAAVLRSVASAARR
jgi:hypothetical protein